MKESYSRRILSSATSVFPTKFVMFLINGSIVLTAILFLAIFLQGVFYYAYVPQAFLDRQLHFQRAEVTKETRYRERVTTTQLRAEVHLTSDGTGLLAAGSNYAVDLKLDMPDSEVNNGLGTFLVTAKFLDKENNEKTSSSRLIMLKYKSWLLRIIDTVVFSPLYLFEIYDQNQIKVIPLYKNYHEQAYKHTSSIIITIDNPNVQIYQAHLSLIVQYTGIRYFMYYWPITSSIIGICMIFSLLTVVAFSSYLSLFPRSDPSSPPTKSAKGDPVEHVGSSDLGVSANIGLDGSTDNLDTEMRKRNVNSFD